MARRTPRGSQRRQRRRHRQRRQRQRQQRREEKQGRTSFSFDLSQKRDSWQRWRGKNVQEDLFSTGMLFLAFRNMRGRTKFASTSAF